MSDTFRAAMAFVRYWEGGWSNHKADPGGLTKWGVTIKTVIAKALDFNGDGKIDARDLEAMTPDQAEALYRADYFDAIRGDDLPPAVAVLAFDCAVNQGPGRSGRWLQECAGMTGKAIDGAVGPMTVAAVARAFNADERGFLREFQVRRALHYSSLSSFVTFGRGWFRRLIDGTIEAARLGQMVEVRIETPTTPVDPVIAGTIADFLDDVAANAEASARQARDAAGVADDVAADLRDRALDLRIENGVEA